MITGAAVSGASLTALPPPPRGPRLRAPRGGEGRAATRWFRGTVSLADGAPEHARLVIAVDDGFTAYVNGAEAAERDALAVHKSWGGLGRQRTSLCGRRVRPGPSARPTGSIRPRHAPTGCGR
ncbi:hypothetical protein GCM10027091_64540 [Streptomyces daliensis]